MLKLSFDQISIHSVKCNLEIADSLCRLKNRFDSMFSDIFLFFPQ